MVKMLLTWGQLAWMKLKKFSIHQRLNVEHPTTMNSLWKSFAKQITKSSLSHNKTVFNQWLVGFTDGDGTFSIVPPACAPSQNNKWSLTFKIGQSAYNLRVLHFIKKQLGVGSIYVEGN